MDHSAGRKKLYVIVGAIIVFVIILISVFSGKEEAPLATSPPPKATTSTIDVPTRAIGPPIMNPQRPIGLAKDAADKVNENQSDVAETYEQLESEQRSN
jgi:hypothetical protein